MGATVAFETSLHQEPFSQSCYEYDTRRYKGSTKNGAALGNNTTGTPVLSEQVHWWTEKQAAPLCTGPGVDLTPHPSRPPSLLCRGLLIYGSILGTLQNMCVGLPTLKFSPGFLSHTCMEGENRLSDMISKDAGRAWSWSGGQSAME